MITVMFMCLQLMKIYLTYHIDPNSAAIAIARVKHDGSGVELQGLFLTVYCTAHYRSLALETVHCRS